MKNQLIIATVTLLVFGVLTGVIVWQHGIISKIVYINNAELYENFTLKKELESRLLAFETLNREILDSLETEFEKLKRNENASQEKILLIQQEYYWRKQAHESELNDLVDSYDSQIWNQINTYLAEFGKANNYTLVLGTLNSGNIMYAEPGRDITSKAIEFINRRYEGKL